MEGRPSADQFAEDEARLRLEVRVSPLFFVRLNRFLSQCGMGSRRGCEQIIVEGRVSINGREVKDLATKVEPGDQVSVDGRSVRTETEVVLALNKPRGYLCTRADTHDRMTIYELLPTQYQTLHHVGRLDKESEGLILLTNRGDLSHRLIHPSMGAEKEYEVIVDKPLDSTIMAKLVKGMMTEEGHAKAERAWMDGGFRAHVVLKQGLKRQIRLMFYQLGFEVERLIRTRIGWLELRGLPKGGWKELTTAEVGRFLSKDGGGRPPKLAKPKKPAAKDAPEATEKPLAKKRAGAPPKRSSKGRTEGPATKRPSRGKPADSREERPIRSRSASAKSDRPARNWGDDAKADRPVRGRSAPAKSDRPARNWRDDATADRPFRGRAEDSRGERPAPGMRDDGKVGKPPRGKAGGPASTSRKGTRRTDWGKNVPNRDAPRRHRSGR